MASDQSRETVVIIDEPERSSALRDGLAQRWVVLEPRLDDFGSGEEDQVDAAVTPLASGPYGLIGVSLRRVGGHPPCPAIAGQHIGAGSHLAPGGTARWSAGGIYPRPGVAAPRYPVPHARNLRTGGRHNRPGSPQSVPEPHPQLQRRFRLRRRSRHLRRTPGGLVEPRRGLPGTARNLHRAAPQRRHKSLIAAANRPSNPPVPAALPVARRSARGFARKSAARPSPASQRRCRSATGGAPRVPPSSSEPANR